MFGHNSFTHPFEAPNGWMQPTETKTFNSLWVGDQHKITTTTGGKNKFRKTPSPPPNVSRKKITLQNQQTIYKYLPDRPEYHQYITGSNYKTDYQSRERLASKYTQITDLNEELGGIEQELDGLYAKKEELEGKLVSLTQKLDNLNDSYERELASYTTTYWKDNDFKRRKSQDIANGAKKWKQAKARQNAQRRRRRRAEGQGFAAEEFPTIFDVAPDAGKEGEIVEIRWDESAKCGPTDAEVGGYRPQFIDGTAGCTVKSAADTVKWLRTVLTKSKGQGMKFVSLSPADITANCAERDCDNGDENGDENGDNGEDETQEKGFNWLLWGGIATVALFVTMG